MIQDSDQIVGEIRMFAGNFAPAGWAFCHGQLLPIHSEYGLLFQFIGTKWGGDGVKNFALPDLRGRLPISQGTSAANIPYKLGQTGGVETVSLTLEQTPNHTHTLSASDVPATSGDPSNQLTARTVNVHSSSSSEEAMYLKAGSPTVNGFELALRALTSAGNTQPHSNIMPCVAINFIIATNGIYPHFES